MNIVQIPYPIFMYKLLRRCKMPKQIVDARKKLLKNGEAILLNDGYFGLSVSKLARKCNMATGTFYSYFFSKAELTEIILQSGKNRMLANLDIIVNSKASFKQKLDNIYLELKNFSDRYLIIWTQFGAEKDNMERFKEMEATCIQQIAERVKKVVLEVLSSDPKMHISVSIDVLSMIIIHNSFIIAKTPMFSFKNFVEVLWQCIFVSKN